MLASLPAWQTSVVVYDTNVVDLTAALSDPVELLFGTQIGGGNRTDLAPAYCRGLVRRPQETILVLISDLIEGHTSAAMLGRMRELVSAGVNVIALLALDDPGAPPFDRENAAAMVAMGIPSFACTPDLLPELMAASLNRQDVSQWAVAHDIVLAGCAAHAEGLHPQVGPDCGRKYSAGKRWQAHRGVKRKGATNARPTLDPRHYAKLFTASSSLSKISNTVTSLVIVSRSLMRLVTPSNFSSPPARLTVV